MNKCDIDPPDRPTRHSRTAIIYMYVCVFRSFRHSSIHPSIHTATIRITHSLIDVCVVLHACVN